MDTKICLVLCCVLIVLSLPIMVYCAKDEHLPTEPTMATTYPTETQRPVTEPTTTPQPTETEATEATSEEITYFCVPLSEDLQIHIFGLCQNYGIDPAIIVAMCYRESSYDASKIGDGGDSYGLMQIQVKWHYDRMLKLDSTNLLNPFHNVTVGVDYLAELLDRYDGDMAKALVAYNQGNFNGTITQYAIDVLTKSEELKGETYVH